MDPLALTLLGRPEVRYEGQTLSLQHRHIALVSYIALQGRPCSRDELAETLWGAGRSSNLRVALYKLRKQPGAEDWFEDGERLNVRAHSDVNVLERALEGGTLSATVFEQLERAADPELGRLLLDLSVPTPAYETWLEEQRQRVSTLVERLLLKAAEDLQESGQLTRASGFAEKLLRRDPLNEEAYRLLMRCEAERGRPEVAQEVYERLRKVLEEQLGEEPSEETRALHKHLLGTGTGARALRLRPGDPVPGKAARLFGRATLLEEVHHVLETGATLLHGLGGIGKTALAAEVATRYLKKGDVLWLQAGLSSANELLEAAGQALKVQGAASKPEALNAALSGGAVKLLVVDDAWDDAALQGLRSRLPDTLPLLVTARQRFKGLTRLDVGRLGRPDARQLLAFGTEREFADDEADRVCDVLGDHPFALRLAGAKLKHDRLSPQQLLAQLANAPHALQTPKGWREEGRESVSALLQASLEALSDNAYDAFLAIGALASSTVTAPLLARALRRDVESTEGALIELHTRALAERAASPGSDLVRYTLHDLSHSFARQNTTVRAQTVVRACRDFVAVANKNFEGLEAEIGNIVGALGAAQEAEERGVLVDVMAELVIGEAYFSARGHTPRSLGLLEVAVRWAKELGQLERAHYFSTKLGDTYRVQYHQYMKALEAYIEGARLARFTKDIAREAILMSLCASTRFLLGQPPEEDFERAYQLARQTDDGLIIGHILQNRGYVATFYRNWALVESLNAEAIKVAHALTHTPDVEQAHIDDLLFFSLLNLGEAKRKLGNFEEALTLRKEALKIATTRDNQMWQAYALHELGEMYLDVQQRQTAEHYLKQALRLYKVNHAQAEIELVQQLLTNHNSRPVDA